MKILIYFIFGILFYELVLPILEGLAGIILTKCEVHKGRMSEEIAEINQRIQNGKEPPRHAIGFCVSSTEEDDEYFDED